MNSFQNILQAKLSQATPKAPAMDEKTIQFLFEKVIQEYYGVKGKSNVLPLGFKGGVLVLGIYKSLWQAEVSINKEELRESVNKKIGEELVRSIRIQRK
jgi:hypothetical protein